MATQQNPTPSPSSDQPKQSPPGWVRVLFWSVFGVVSAIFIATFISCPILLILWLLYPQAIQPGPDQSASPVSSNSTLTPGSTGSASAGTPSTPLSATDSAAGGTALALTATFEAESEGTASSPSGDVPAGGTALALTATFEAGSGGTASSPSGTDQATSSSTVASLTPAANSLTPAASGVPVTSEPGAQSTTSSPGGTPEPGEGTSITNPATSDGSLASITPSLSTLTPGNLDLTPTSTTPTLPPSNLPTRPSSTPTPTATVTPTPTVPTSTPTPRGPTPPPQRTPAPSTVVLPRILPPTLAPLPTNTPVQPTATPTSTNSTPVGNQPVSTRIVAPAAAPDLPGGILSLIEPISVEIPPTRGPTTFIWEWLGDPLPPEYGFEVRVWLTGEPQAGVHDAILDRREGRIESAGPDRYQLKVGNIRYAKGVLGREGIYNWTVAVVRVSPAYADFGLQAVPARFLYEPFRTGR